MSNVKYSFIFLISNHSGTPKLFPDGNNGAGYCPQGLLPPGGSVVKNPPTNAGDVGSVPGLGRSPGGGNDNPLQYSCLGNPMDRGTWWAKVHGIARVIRDLVTKQLPSDLPSLPLLPNWHYKIQKKPSSKGGPAMTVGRKRARLASSLGDQKKVKFGNPL